MKPEGTIVIPQYGRTELTLNCIRSLRAVDATEWPIVVVSDGCPDEERDRLNEALENEERITILNLSHAGVTASWNAGIECAEERFIVLLNNDTVSLGSWVVGLLEPLRSGRGWISGVRMREEPELKRLAGGRDFPAQVLEGWCLGFSKDAWQRLGGFDETLRTYWSDTDFQWRGAMAFNGEGSLAAGVVENLPIQHLGHRTTHQDDLRIHLRECWREDRRRFRRKWRRILREAGPLVERE